MHFTSNRRNTPLRRFFIESGKKDLKKGHFMLVFGKFAVFGALPQDFLNKLKIYMYNIEVNLFLGILCVLCPRKAQTQRMRGFYG